MAVPVGPVVHGLVGVVPVVADVHRCFRRYMGRWPRRRWSPSHGVCPCRRRTAQRHYRTWAAGLLGDDCSLVIVQPHDRDALLSLGAAQQAGVAPHLVDVDDAGAGGW